MRRRGKHYKYFMVPEEPCLLCGEEFLTDSYNPNKFCTVKCRNKYYRINTVGMIVGSSKVISEYKEDDVHYCKCLCLRCDEEFVRERQLILKDIRKGNDRSCPGCRYVYDFNNKKIGRLTILGFAHKNEKLNAVWSCECECGTEIEKTSEYLNKSPEPNCGCRAKEIAIQNSPYENLSIEDSYTKSNIASYETYASQLDWAEWVEKETIGSLITFKVLCTYCGQAFIPTLDQVIVRSYYLKGLGRPEGRFYCGNTCKAACPIFGQQKFPKGHNKTLEATSREVQRELRQLVLARDEWICQYGACGKTVHDAELHCHHFEGINLNPIESADMDMCITFCKKHHLKVHDQKDCRYFELTCDYIMKNQAQ